MNCLQKSDFLKPINRKKVKYEVLELGGYVWIAAISALDLLDLRESHDLENATDNMPFTYDLLSRSLIDDEGNRIFETPEDVKNNFGISVDEMLKLSDQCVKVSGLEKKVE